MKHGHLPLFAEQRQRYELRFTCEHCAYFVADDGRCSHGYPNQEHRAARYEQGSAELVFCKDFELR